MTLPILTILMIFAALTGGSVNYLLPANRSEQGIINRWWQCVVLGFGATLLVPLFLELAQSKLLDGLTLNWALTAKQKSNCNLKGFPAKYDPGYG